MFDLLLQKIYITKEGLSKVKMEGLKGRSYEIKAGLRVLCELTLASGEGCISSLTGDVTSHMCHLIQDLAHVWVCVLVYAPEWLPGHAFHWQCEDTLAGPHIFDVHCVNACCFQR